MKEKAIERKKENGTGKQLNSKHFSLLFYKKGEYLWF